MRKELLGLKILAVVLALVIWIQSALVEEHKSTIKLPVHLINSPKDITIEDAPQKVPFLVQGKGIELLKLMISKPYISLDASKLRPGEDILSLSSYQIIVPDNVQLQIIGPAQNDNIRVSADTHMEKQVPVNLSFANEQIRRDFANKSISITPDRVTLSGAASIVNEIKSINTIPLNRNHLSMGNFRVALQIPEGQISADSREIRVSISSSPELTKVFSGISLAEADRDNYFPNKLSVKISGDVQMIDSLRTSSLEIMVSENPDSDGFHRVNVRVPEGLKLIDISPNRIRTVN